MPAKKHSFQATLGSDDPGSLFIEVPFDVKAAFGKARPPIKVTVNGHTYRSTIAVYAGRSFIPVRKSNRDAAGVAVGDVVAVTIQADDAPRTVEPPPALAKALAKNARARAAWAKLSFSHQREHADHVAGAKQPETVARRVKKTIETLVAKPR